MRIAGSKGVATTLLLVIVLSGSAAAASLTPPMAAVVSKQTAPQLSRLTVSPAIVEFGLSKPTEYTKTVTLINNGSVALPIHMLSSSYALSPDQAPLGSRGVALLDSASWLSANQQDFILSPGAPHQVRLRVTIPHGAAPGDHYATVYFQPLEQLRSDGVRQESFSSGRVSVLLLMTVPGQLMQQAALQKVSAPIIHQPGTVALGIALGNTGNIHLLPHGTITVRRGNKRVVSYDLPPGLILSQTQRNYTWQWSHAAIGHYHISGRITYGSPARVLTFNRSIWILPWIPVFIIILGGGGLLFIMLRTRGRWRRAWQALSKPSSSSGQKKHKIPCAF